MSDSTGGSVATSMIDERSLVVRGPNDLTPVLNMYSDVAARINSHLEISRKKMGRVMTPEVLKVPISDSIGDLDEYGGAQDSKNVTNPFYADIVRIIREGDGILDRVELQKTACFWAIYILANKTAKVQKRNKVAAPGVVAEELDIVNGVAIPASILQEFMSHAHTQKWLEAKQEKMPPVNMTQAMDARVGMFVPSLYSFMFLFAQAVNAGDFTMRNTLFGVMPEIMVSFRYGIMQVAEKFPSIVEFLNSCGVCGDTSGHCSGDRALSLIVKSVYCILKLLLAANPGFILGIEFGDRKTLNIVLYLVAYMSVKSSNIVRVVKGQAQTIYKQYVQSTSVAIASGTHISKAILAIGSEQQLLQNVVKHVMGTVEKDASSSFQGCDSARLLVSFLVKMAEFAIAFAGDSKAQATSPQIAEHILSRLVANKLFPFNKKAEDSAINSVATESSGSLFFPIAVRENPDGSAKLTGAAIDFARDVVDEVAAKFMENNKDKVKGMHVEYIEEVRRTMIFSSHCEDSHPYKELQRSAESSSKASKKPRLGM